MYNNYSYAYLYKVYKSVSFFKHRGLWWQLMDVKFNKSWNAEKISFGWGNANIGLILKETITMKYDASACWFNQKLSLSLRQLYASQKIGEHDL